LNIFAHPVPVAPFTPASGPVPVVPPPVPAHSAADFALVLVTVRVAAVPFAFVFDPFLVVVPLTFVLVGAVSVPHPVDFRPVVLTSPAQVHPPVSILDYLYC
jgi:hypothetical protein